MFCFVVVFIVIYGFSCFAITNKKLKNDDFDYRLEVYQANQQKQKKKTQKAIKKELPGSLIEFEDEDELELKELVKNLKESKKAITLIKRYKNILKAQNKKIINLVGKQGELLR